MKIRFFILYWLLIIIPAMVIGGFALRLLRHEQERVVRANLTALENRARATAQSIELTLLETVDNLREQLLRIESDHRSAELRRRQRENPLIRNVFVWHREGGLQVPDPERPGNREEERFVQRYERLFRGELAWESATPQKTMAAEPLFRPRELTGTPSVEAAADDFMDDAIERAAEEIAAGNMQAAPENMYSRQQIARRELWEVSRRGHPMPEASPVFDSDSDLVLPGEAMDGLAETPARARTARAAPAGARFEAAPDTLAEEESRDLASGRARAVAEAAPRDEPAADKAPAPARPEFPVPMVRPAAFPESGRGGCIPWYSENSLHLLVWHQVENGGVIGVELETAALISRLLGLLPDPLENGSVFALLDGRDQVVHQVGDLAEADAMRNLLRVPVGIHLPNWQVAVRIRPDKSSIGGGFFGLALLLAATLLAAIVFGGSLLLWQACLHVRDARRKTSFVSNVSHELKTPLTSIRMFAELLTENRVADPDKRRDYLQVIARESQRLTRLVNNVLNFSRLEQGRKEYHPQSLTLAPAVAAIVASQSERFAKASVTVSQSLPDTLPPIRFDRDSLEQVILNILDNALKYGADGGLVEIAGEVGRDGRPRLLIRDCGKGIPAKHRQRIFRKFHRLDDSLAAERPGSGLGLSIARQIMRDQGGDLQCAAPRQGQPGACFVLTFAGSTNDGEPPARSC